MGGNLNRRDFMELLAGGVAGIVFGAAKARCEKPARPNFVVIFADDLGYGDIGGFGLKEYDAL